MKYWNKKHPRLPALNQAILPVYLLHQTFIVVIGYYVVQQPWGMWPKFGVILGSSLAGMLGTYALVARLKPLRFLFGMKP